jgi:hypothetical protein
MRSSMIGAAAAAFVSALATASPAQSAEVVVHGYAPRAVYVHRYPYFRYYPRYPRVYAPAGYVAVGPNCWRSVRVRVDGAVVYRRVCA